MRPCHRALTLLFCSVLLTPAACSDSPIEPGGSRYPRSFGPSFSVSPNAGAQDTSCGRGIAFNFGDAAHLSNTSASFLVSGTTPRSACGALAFDEDSSSSGRLAIGFTPSEGHVSDWWYLNRKYRRTQGPTAYDSVGVWVDSSAQSSRVDTVSAIALSTKDLLFFELSAHGPPRTVSGFPPSPTDTNFGGESHGGFQLWGAISAPSSFSVGVVSQDRPYLTWHNGHNQRSVDTTEVYRRIGGGAWALRARLGYQDSAFTDTAVSNGTYHYFVRHYTASAPNLAGWVALPLPNSPTSVADSEVIAVTLSVTIDGPDMITTSGTYEWTGSVSGGVAPYEQRWYYYRSPGPNTYVGSGSSYSRTVEVNPGDAYIFRLTDSTTDAASEKVRALYFVEVEDGGDGLQADERQGVAQYVRLQDGTCGLRPPSGPLRQAWLAWLFGLGKVPRTCQPRVS